MEEQIDVKRIKELLSRKLAYHDGLDLLSIDPQKLSLSVSRLERLLYDREKKVKAESYNMNDLLNAVEQTKAKAERAESYSWFGSKNRLHYLVCSLGDSANTVRKRTLDDISKVVDEMSRNLSIIQSTGGNIRSYEKKLKYISMDKNDLDRRIYSETENMLKYMGVQRQAPEQKLIPVKEHLSFIRAAEKFKDYRNDLTSKKARKLAENICHYKGQIMRELSEQGLKETDAMKVPGSRRYLKLLIGVGILADKRDACGDAREALDEMKRQARSVLTETGMYESGFAGALQKHKLDMEIVNLIRSTADAYLKSL